jgi:Outer membrane protein beta-barrel domain
MKQTTLLGLGIALLAPVSSALAADDAMKVEKPIRILAGIFSASEGTSKQRTAIGVGYDFMKTSASNPTVYGVFVDYNSKKSGGLTTSMTGIGVSGRFYLDSANAAGKSYALVGFGSFSLKSQARTTVGTSTTITSNTTSKLGGKVGFGYELNNGFLLEADYNIIQKINSVDPSGFNIRLGYRF